MLKILVILTSVLLFASCSDEMTVFPEPDNLIPKDTMVMVLKEMTLMESHIQSKYIHVARFQKTMLLSGNAILDKYHVTATRYEESMNYYGSHQVEMQEIYSEILDQLNSEATFLGKDINTNQFKLNDEVAPVPFIQGPN
jgi:hypothetical protein